MPRYRFGDVEFDLRGFRLTRAGEPVPVEPKALEVLAFLLENRGRLVDKRELLASVWRDTVVTENALTRVIAQLRKAIGDEARDSRFLETVPTRGYRFLADVDVEPDGNGASAAAVVAPDVPGPKFKRTAIASSVVAILAAVVLGWWLGRRPDPPPASSPRPVKRLLITSTVGFNGFPSFSPDGASLAFVSDRSGRLEIYVKPLAPGGQEIAVTSDGQANVQPAWSPDGRLIAYHSMARGGVWLVPALGGPVRRLTEFGSGPAWSPDGNEIAFQSLSLADLPSISQTPTTLWIAPVAGGAPRPLTPRGQPSGGHGPPSWSPDGRRLVFSAEGVWTIAADGTDLRPLSGTAGSRAAIYGPGGQSVIWAGLVEKESRLFRTRLTADGEPAGAPEELASGAADILRHLALSREGRRLAFARVNVWSGIVTVPVGAAEMPAGAPSPPPLTQKSVGRKFSPVFSHDGRRLAYMVFRPGAGAELWVRDVDKGTERQVLFEAGGGRPVTTDWFPDGERLLMAVLDGGSSRFFSVSLSGESKPLVAVQRAVERPRLTPDGRAVVFQSLTEGVLNVWKASLETGDLQQLTTDKEGVGWPVPSPDGRWLGVELFRGPDSTLISLMPADGGPLRPIVATPGQNWLHSWSGDSRHLAFAARRDGVWNVYSVSLDGEERQLTRYGDVRSFVRYPAWSPRGDQIALERTTTTSDVWVMDLEP